MMRWLGGIMILTGSLGLGLWYRQQFRQRIIYLRQMVGVLEILMSEIRYGKTTLPQACKNAGIQIKGPLGEALVQVFVKMQENTGEIFGEVFSCHLGNVMRQLPLNREDVEAFLRFAGQNSFSDTSMQLRSLEQSRDMLDETVRGLEKVTEEKGRLAVGLGAMSGLLVVIVLL